ncbi:hypothetical protein [Nocardia pseudobrasiliensis]|uniref:hypothetical protein n=1 Tax=Nocardia pseudobrasiliensis TaxID=45979 RepID=UPI0012E97023|nr:hypothetical protein [Nocardia pseudobrasiliensis]
MRGASGAVAVAVDDLTGLLADQTRALGPQHPDVRDTTAELDSWRARLTED